jgi:hypothetical protein
MADLSPAAESPAQALPDVAHVRGQEVGRRALEVAAAGGHSLLLVGPKGWGKSSLARCLPGLLPPLETGRPAAGEAGAQDTAEPATAGGTGSRDRTASTRPVHALPFTVRPREVGEAVQRAAGGVLLLDDLPAFNRRSLHALADAMDAERLQVVATMRSCPCGRLGGSMVACQCAPREVSRYLGRAIAHLRGRRTQAAVAEVVGVDPGVWSLWETGARVPKEGNLARIVTALGCSRLELEKAVWRFRRERLGGMQTGGPGADAASVLAEVVRFADPARRGQEHEAPDPLRQELRPVIRRLAEVLEGLLMLWLRGHPGTAPGAEAPSHGAHAASGTGATPGAQAAPGGQSVHGAVAAPGGQSVHGAVAAFGTDAAGATSAPPAAGGPRAARAG